MKWSGCLRPSLILRFWGVPSFSVRHADLSGPLYNSKYQKDWTSVFSYLHPTLALLSLDDNPTAPIHAWCMQHEASFSPWAYWAEGGRISIPVANHIGRYLVISDLSANSCFVTTVSGWKSWQLKKAKLGKPHRRVHLALG